MSGGETILYAYGAVCVCMILFNVVYNLIRNRRDRRIGQRSARLQEDAVRQLDRLEDGGWFENGYMNRLIKKLKKVDWLIAFDRMLDDPSVQEHPSFELYERTVLERILVLADEYSRRQDMEAAYYAFFLSGCSVLRQMDTTAVQECLTGYMKLPNVYCRVNALQALYSFGSRESIVGALETLDRMEGTVHEKIITDGLLSYWGSHEELIQLFWERYDHFSDRLKHPILNYIRYRTGSCKDRMFEILADEKEDKELRLAAMRYFGKYPWKPAHELLCTFVRENDPVDWEYSAVAAACLAAYPGGKTVDVLMDALYSTNWYVRNNASASLDAFHLDYRELGRVVDGRDRYAREMMMYRLDARALDEEKKKTGQGEAVS